MKQKVKNFKEKITSKEVMLRVMIVILTAVLVYYADNTERQLINIIGFLVSFFISIYLHKHFFPLMTAALFFYLVASLQEFWNIKYIYSIITETYWFIGNTFLIGSIIKFAWDLKYKYKIVEHEDS